MLRPLAAIALASIAPVLIADPAPARSIRDDPNKIFCKEEARTGTRFRTRICYTRAQWDAIEEQHKRDAREMIDRPVIEIRRG